MLSFWRISISSLFNLWPEVFNDYFSLCSETFIFSGSSLASSRALLCKLLKKPDSIFSYSFCTFSTRCLRISSINISVESWCCYPGSKLRLCWMCMLIPEIAEMVSGINPSSFFIGNILVALYIIIKRSFKFVFIHHI